MIDSTSKYYERNILDEAGLKVLFDSFFRSLCLFAYKYTGDHDLSKDVVQECFTELWRSRGNLESVGNAKAYLYMMVRNKCLNQMRKKDNRETLNSADSESYFENTFVRSETIRILYDAINELPSQAQRIINYSLDGLKNQEIADEMMISVNTVHSLKKSAYKKLKESLKEHYYLFVLLLP